MAKFLGPFFSKPILSKEVEPDFSLFYELGQLFSKIPLNAKIGIALYMWNNDDGLNKKGYHHKWQNVPGNPKNITEIFLSKIKSSDCEIILDNYISQYHAKTLGFLIDNIGEAGLIVDTRTGVNDPEIRRKLYESHKMAKIGYMHDKFILISELEGIGKHIVVQTTANINITQCHQFNNAIVVYDDEYLYSKYLAHWENLKNKILTRQLNSQNGTDLPEEENVYAGLPLNLDKQVNVFFFPRNDCPIEEELSNLLTVDYKCQIDICMAYLTRLRTRSILKKLSKLHKIRIILSEEDQNQTTIDSFKDCNISLKIIKNKRYNTEVGLDENGERRILDNWKARMHHKFLLINGDKHKIVWTGSYNLTYPGLKLNDETVLRIKDSQVHRAYTKIFNMLWTPVKSMKKIF